MREKSDETVVVRPNEIRLVRRPDSDRWQAHYKVEAIGRWLRKATGTADVDRARLIAEEQWMEARILARSGHPVVSKKFKAVAETVQRDLEAKIAADATKRGSNNDYVATIKNYLIPYFGNYNVDRVTTEVFNDFCEWRRQKVGKELSQSAQSNHNAALNLVFDNAIEKGFMTTLQRPALKNTGVAGGRRPDFSAKDVEAICGHLPGWINDARLERSRMIRELLSVYIPFVAATGMRPGTEMEFLEWRHLEVHKVGDEPVLYAHIQRGKTVKKNKPMGAVLHRSCWLLLEKIRQFTPEFAGKTLHQVLDEKPALKIFRMRDGTQPNQLSKQFKQLLIEMKLLDCPITGEERTLYSLRHYAITQMVAKGLTAEQMQSQVRTSAVMISKFYNHMQPLMNAAQFAGQGAGQSGDEISQIINNTPNDNMLHFAEISTGLTLSLVLQNKPAVDELREALAQASAGAAPN
jgi:integrase